MSMVGENRVLNGRRRRGPTTDQYGGQPGCQPHQSGFDARNLREYRASKTLRVNALHTSRAREAGAAETLQCAVARATLRLSAILVLRCPLSSAAINPHVFIHFDCATVAAVISVIRRTVSRRARSHVYLIFTRRIELCKRQSTPSGVRVFFCCIFDLVRRLQRFSSFCAVDGAAFTEHNLTYEHRQRSNLTHLAQPNLIPASVSRLVSALVCTGVIAIYNNMFLCFRQLSFHKYTYLCFVNY